MSAEISPATLTLCNICVKEIDPSQPKGILGCRHVFHINCIEKWLTEKHNCPTCLDPVSAPVYPGSIDGLRISEVAKFAKEEISTVSTTPRSNDQSEKFTELTADEDLNFLSVVQRVERLLKTE